MQLSDYDYELPAAAIALHPPKERGASRLLVLHKRTGALGDSYYRKLADFLQAGDVLVVNNTRVVPARLIAKTDEGDERELLLLEKHGRSSNTHKSMVMYRRRLRPGQKLRIDQTELTVEERDSAP
jgi:S-adenosylmethionine:tRNA ribosyltransferase-isomerase